MEIKNWLENILQNESPDSSIIAYNFGIFESEKGYMIYLSGSTEFDEEDSDWACNDDFEPKEKYLLLPESLQNIDWEELLSKLEFQLKLILDSPMVKSSFLAESVAITMGFDEGDLLRLK